MNSITELRPLPVTLQTVGQGIVAGAAGGLAEIGWVTLYATATGTNPAILARGVTTAVGVSALLPAWTVALGATVHLLFAVTLGIALSFVWRALSSHRLKTARPYPLIIASLAGVWALNFFAVLPIISPAFIHLLPYPISLISKMLFGLAAAETFRLMSASVLNTSPVRRF
jgi:hypothetical protein